MEFMLISSVRNQDLFPTQLSCLQIFVSRNLRIKSSSHLQGTQAPYISTLTSMTHESASVSSSAAQTSNTFS